MTLLSKACVSHLVETIYVFRTISKIFSVKEWRVLKTGVGVVQGH